MQQYEQHKYCNLHAKKETLLSLGSLSQPDLWSRYLLQVVSCWLLTWSVCVCVCVCVCRWWCGCRWCFSWLWRNHLEEHSQESNRPCLRNHMCASVEMFEIELKYSFSNFGLLCSIAKSYQSSTMKYAITHSFFWLSTVMFESNTSSLATYLQM